jgi:hypothetical protein
MQRITIVLLSCAFLGACSTPLPRSPEFSTDEVIKKSSLSTGANSSLTLEQSKHLLSGWRNIYNDAQAGRHDLDLFFGESIFYGSIMTVLGIATHHDRLRNIGAGIVGMATLTDGHYKLATQRAAFQKAESRIACLEKATLQVTPKYVESFSTPVSLRETLTDLPGLIFTHTKTIHNELRVELQAIKLTAPTRQEIEDAFTKLKEAKESVPNSIAIDAQEKANHLSAFSKTVNQKQLEEEKRAYIRGLTTVKQEMAVCMKT